MAGQRGTRRWGAMPRSGCLGGPDAGPEWFRRVAVGQFKPGQSPHVVESVIVEYQRDLDLASSWRRIAGPGAICPWGSADGSKGSRCASLPNVVNLGGEW